MKPVPCVGLVVVAVGRYNVMGAATKDLVVVLALENLCTLVSGATYTFSRSAGTTTTATRAITAFRLIRVVAGHGVGQVFLW